MMALRVRTRPAARFLLTAVLMTAERRTFSSGYRCSSLTTLSRTVTTRLRRSFHSSLVMAVDTAAGTSLFTFENVKNLRDIASVGGNVKIRSGCVYRTGYISRCSEGDAEKILSEIGVQTLIDLRSTKELEVDDKLYSGVYLSFVNVPDEEGVRPPAPKEKQRYFVSLMSERIYQIGIFKRMRKRHKAKLLALMGASALSDRAKLEARNMFLARINEGGLVLLNELILDYSGQAIARALEIIAEPGTHPIALYCTAGKDRTGLITALALATVGVEDAYIVADYTLSHSVYQDMDDAKAMVAALNQVELNPETFLGAPAYVMADTLVHIRTKYGSLESYLDRIGFTSTWREKLKKSLLLPTSAPVS